MQAFNNSFAPTISIGEHSNAYYSNLSTHMQIWKNNEEPLWTLGIQSYRYRILIRYCTVILPVSYKQHRISCAIIKDAFFAKYLAAVQCNMRKYDCTIWRIIHLLDDLLQSNRNLLVDSRYKAKKPFCVGMSL